MTTSSASSSESSTSRARKGVRESVSICPLRNLVQDQPVQAKLAHGFGKSGKADGFPHVAIGTQAVAANEILLLIGRRQNHHGQPPRALVSPNPPQDLQTVDL